MRSRDLDEILGLGSNFGLSLDEIPEAGQPWNFDLGSEDAQEIKRLARSRRHRMDEIEEEDL